VLGVVDDVSGSRSLSAIEGPLFAVVLFKSVTDCISQANATLSTSVVYGLLIIVKIDVVPEHMAN
jgi:hypothetical protein